MEPNSPASNGLLGYVVLGFLWLALAAITFFASHKVNTALVNVEIAACFWLQGILLKTGLKRKAASLIAVAVLLGASGIDWVLGIL